MRNAVQACGNGTVTLGVTRTNRGVELVVVNGSRPARPEQPGMGVGILVARAIVEAHGGTLSRVTDTAGQTRATIALPLVGEPE